MPELDDPKWSHLEGGYRKPYDASQALKRLAAGEGDAWAELWENLHHQGDVGEASYAAVPHLVRIAGASAQRDWNVYALVALIEIERHRKSNPPLPSWLHTEYESAWREIEALALRDLSTTRDALVIRSALSVVALARGERKLGALLAYVDESEIEQFAEDLLAWSQLYG